MVSLSLGGHSVPPEWTALEIAPAQVLNAETFEISSLCSTGPVASSSKRRKRHAEGMPIVPNGFAPTR
jgi:hypothetical protein